MKKLAGNAYPLGATPDKGGVNFALFSDNATEVHLYLFDHHQDTHPSQVIPLTEKTHSVWHCYLRGLQAGQLYGYKVNGPFDPASGHRFNFNKLLIDPYAKAVSGTLQWDDALFGYLMDQDGDEQVPSESDSTPFIPKSIVIDDAFNWEGDQPLRIPYEQTVIYETHVKGFSKLNESIPEPLRGTYSGLATPESIRHLKSLGITAVELMPIHHFVSDRVLQEKNLSNYWGYNSIGFFAPDVRYAASGFLGEQVQEFKQMVKTLHREGIEVILDVVYNHTAEGNHLGPTLSFRGIDNAAYYRLQEDKRYYRDYTGTGNTLNAMQPNVLRLIMDSLRYWIQEMHVDGFRFDLASTLARELHEVDRLGSFFDIIHQDPVINRVKLIAEPWDLGEGGYQVGKFPPGWAEWNGMYRDCIRDYWRGADSMLAEFAGRFTGSADLYRDDRYPNASINFVTAHDGFTLRDLVSYNEKHNAANGEDSRDGTDENRSWNCGVEGPTDDPEILALRSRQVRNFLTTLFLSQGVPMLVAGDETGRTQQGNNNAYCQDNEISWLDWSTIDKDLLAFTQRLIHIRKSHPVFTYARWFRGEPAAGHEVEDIAWFLPQGTPMSDENWEHDFAKSLAVFIYGKGIHSLGPEGQPIVDDSFYILFNAHHEPLDFRLPEKKYGEAWSYLIDTAAHPDFSATLGPGASVTAAPRSMIVLIHKTTG